MKRAVLKFLSLALVLCMCFPILAACSSGEAPKGADGKDGIDGKDGVSIVSVDKVSSQGLNDTYKIS